MVIGLLFFGIMVTIAGVAIKEHREMKQLIGGMDERREERQVELMMSVDEREETERFLESCG